MTTSKQPEIRFDPPAETAQQVKAHLDSLGDGLERQREVIIVADSKLCSYFLDINDAMGFYNLFVWNYFLPSITIKMDF